MELIERAITEALEDPELRVINSELIQNHIARVDEEEERKILRILQKLIDITRPDQAAGSIPSQDQSQSGRGVDRYRPNDPPRYFEFADLRRPLQIEPGKTTYIDIKTDGPNNMFTRERHRAALSLEAIGGQDITMVRGRLNNGRLQIIVSARPDFLSNARYTLRATLQMDGGIYILTERTCIITPPPPPYLGVDPPTFLKFAAKGDKLQFKRGQTSRILLRSDCQNDFLSRTETPGQFVFISELPEITLIGWKHPFDGEMELKIKADDTLEAGRETTITVRFVGSDGAVLEDAKSCVIVEPPTDERRSGRQQSKTGNIALIKVWRTPPPDDPTALTWNQLDWNEEKVGKYSIDKDPKDPEGKRDILMLYINMDHSELERERRRRLQIHGVSMEKNFERRYAAYIGYHLWLCCEQIESLGTRVSSGEQGGSEQPGEERKPEIQEQERAMEVEMARVAKTIIQALRSESDLRSEETIPDQES